MALGCCSSSPSLHTTLKDFFPSSTFPLLQKFLVQPTNQLFTPSTPLQEILLLCRLPPPPTPLFFFLQKCSCSGFKVSLCLPPLALTCVPFDWKAAPHEAVNKTGSSCALARCEQLGQIHHVYCHDSRNRTKRKNSSFLCFWGLHCCGSPFQYWNSYGWTHCRKRMKRFPLTQDQQATLGSWVVNWSCCMYVFFKGFSLSLFLTIKVILINFLYN